MLYALNPPVGRTCRSFCILIGCLLVLGTADASHVRRSTTAELRNLKSLVPAIKAWQTAIERQDVVKAKAAGERYDAIWNGIEAYVNARSFPLYLDLEVDTQDAMDDELAKPTPDFGRLSKLAKHLQRDFKAAYALAVAGPALNPLFDDVAQLRKVRSDLRTVDSALKRGDVGQAVIYLERFKQAYPAVVPLLAMRSETGEGEIARASSELERQISRSSQVNESMSAAMATLLERYNFVLSLHNAAARAAVNRKASPTDEDRQSLRLLQQLENELAAGYGQFPSDPASAARGAATGGGSTFAQVQPALEAKARLVNTAATLRTALVAYEKTVTTNPGPANADAQKAYKSAVEAIELARHTLVGQFWADPDLQAYIASLVTNRK